MVFLPMAICAVLDLESAENSLGGTRSVEVPESIYDE